MAPDPRVGTRFGPYRIDALLGRGGMGAVYDAYDTVKGRRIALKLLHAELAQSSDFAERFRRESHTAAQVAEPHVIPIHDWGEIDGVLYIDMRYVAGHDLRSLIRGAGPLAPARAVAIVTQVGSALDAAHRAGLVHRDIKPDNVLVTDDDFAYLVDFGIAQGVTDTRLTAAGSAIGSHAYMAPERFDGHPGDTAADVYALACVLHECLTGRVPFPATTAAGVMRAHLMDPPPRASLVPGVPAAFDAVIATGMAKNPGQRYPTAGALTRAAAAALAGGAAGGDRRREPPTRGLPPATLYGVDPAPGSTRHDSGHTPAATRYDSGPTPGVVGPVPTRSGTGWPPPGTGHPVPVYAAPQAPPPQRRSAVPALLATVVVVLLVLVGVLVWYVMSKERDTAGPQTGSSTRTVPGSSGSTSGSPTTPTTSSTPTTASTPPLLGTVSGTDDHGFVSSLARCDGDDLAQFILRTTAPAGKDESLVVICQNTDGGLYYHGARGSGDLRVADVARSGDGYIATNGSHRYAVSPTGLRITENGSLLADEPVAEYAYRR